MEVVYDDAVGMLPAAPQMRVIRWQIIMGVKELDTRINLLI